MVPSSKLSEAVSAILPADILVKQKPVGNESSNSDNSGTGLNREQFREHCMNIAGRDAMLRAIADRREQTEQSNHAVNEAQIATLQTA